jgi:hypothetical protein
MKPSEEDRLEEGFAVNLREIGEIVCLLFLWVVEGFFGFRDERLVESLMLLHQKVLY